MAIHDTDKGSSDRSSPMPNSHDLLQDSRPAHGTTSFDPKTDATTAKGFLQSKNGRLLGNDGTNNVGLFGFDDAGNMVVKIAKSGFDANSASNANLIFNSGQDVFKIVSKVPISVSYSHTNPTAEYHQGSVAHGLGYTPAFIAMIVLDAGMVSFFGNNVIGNRGNPALLYGSNAGNVIFKCLAEVDVDGTNAYLTVQTGGAEPTASYTFTATAYLLQETFS